MLTDFQSIAFLIAAILLVAILCAVLKHSHNVHVHCKRSNSPPVAQLGSLRGVIVEPRNHPALEPVIMNIWEKLQIPITLVHGTENRAYARKIADNLKFIDMLIGVNAANLNAFTYSKLLLTEEFWTTTSKKNDAKILIFQTDSGICGEGDDFLNFTVYDYCGAPWADGVGNGGFSIRSKAMAIKHIREHEFVAGLHEDVAFSNWCKEDQTCSICDQSTGQEFASESVHSPAWAFHNNWSKPGFEAHLCDFNKVIQERNTGVNAYYKPPDVHAWRPRLSVTMLR